MLFCMYLRRQTPHQADPDVLPECGKRVDSSDKKDWYLHGKWMDVSTIFLSINESCAHFQWEHNIHRLDRLSRPVQSQRREHPCCKVMRPTPPSNMPVLGSDRVNSPHNQSWDRNSSTGDMEPLSCSSTRSWHNTLQLSRNIPNMYNRWDIHNLYSIERSIRQHCQHILRPGYSNTWYVYRSSNAMCFRCKITNWSQQWDGEYVIMCRLGILVFMHVSHTRNTIILVLSYMIHVHMY